MKTYDLKKVLKKHSYNENNSIHVKESMIVFIYLYKASENRFIKTKRIWH